MPGTKVSLIDPSSQSREKNVMFSAAEVRYEVMGAV